jgi:hypothetical protein
MGAMGINMYANVILKFYIFETSFIFEELKDNRDDYEWYDKYFQAFDS